MKKTNKKSDRITFLDEKKGIYKEKLATSSDKYEELTNKIKETCIDPFFEDRYWRVDKVEMIKNEDLQNKYHEKKATIAEEGLTEIESREVYLFSGGSSAKISDDICRDGHRTGLKKRPVLGHTGQGIHFVQHYDILTRYLAFQQLKSSVSVIVYKAILGKVKHVDILTNKDNADPPVPDKEYHCFVPVQPIEPRQPISDAVERSYVYIYEFDETSTPTRYARRVLPYALLTLDRKPCVQLTLPLLAVESGKSDLRWEVQGETRHGFRWTVTRKATSHSLKQKIEQVRRRRSQSKEKNQKQSSITEDCPPVLNRFDREKSSEGKKRGDEPPVLDKHSKLDHIIREIGSKKDRILKIKQQRFAKWTCSNAEEKICTVSSESDELVDKLDNAVSSIHNVQPFQNVTKSVNQETIEQVEHSEQNMINAENNDKGCIAFNKGEAAQNAFLGNDDDSNPCQQLSKSLTDKRERKTAGHHKTKNIPTSMKPFINLTRIDSHGSPTRLTPKKTVMAQQENDGKNGKESRQLNPAVSFGQDKYVCFAGKNISEKEILIPSEKNDSDLIRDKCADNVVSDSYDNTLTNKRSDVNLDGCASKHAVSHMHGESYFVSDNVQSCARDRTNANILEQSICADENEEKKHKGKVSQNVNKTTKYASGEIKRTKNSTSDEQKQSNNVERHLTETEVTKQNGESFQYKKGTSSKSNTRTSVDNVKPAVIGIKSQNQTPSIDIRQNSTDNISYHTAKDPPAQKQQNLNCVSLTYQESKKMKHDEQKQNITDKQKLSPKSFNRSFTELLGQTDTGKKRLIMKIKINSNSNSTFESASNCAQRKKCKEGSDVSNAKANVVQNKHKNKSIRDVKNNFSERHFDTKTHNNKHGRFPAEANKLSTDHVLRTNSQHQNDSFGKNQAFSSKQLQNNGRPKRKTNYRKSFDITILEKRNKHFEQDNNLKTFVSGKLDNAESGITRPSNAMTLNNSRSNNNNGVNCFETQRQNIHDGKEYLDTKNCRENEETTETTQKSHMEQCQYMAGLHLKQASSDTSQNAKENMRSNQFEVLETEISTRLHERKENSNIDNTMSDLNHAIRNKDNFCTDVPINGFGMQNGKDHISKQTEYVKNAQDDLSVENIHSHQQMVIKTAKLPKSLGINQHESFGAVSNSPCSQFPLCEQPTKGTNISPPAGSEAPYLLNVMPSVSSAHNSTSSFRSTMSNQQKHNTLSLVNAKDGHANYAPVPNTILTTAGNFPHLKNILSSEKFLSNRTPRSLKRKADGLPTAKPYAVLGVINSNNKIPCIPIQTTHMDDIERLKYTGCPDAQGTNLNQLKHLPLNVQQHPIHVPSVNNQMPHKNDKAEPSSVGAMKQPKVIQKSKPIVDADLARKLQQFLQKSLDPAQKKQIFTNESCKKQTQQIPNRTKHDSYVKDPLSKAFCDFSNPDVLTTDKRESTRKKDSIPSFSDNSDCRNPFPNICENTKPIAELRHSSDNHSERTEGTVSANVSDNNMGATNRKPTLYRSDSQETVIGGVIGSPAESPFLAQQADTSNNIRISDVEANVMNRNTTMNEHPLDLTISKHKRREVMDGKALPKSQVDLQSSKNTVTNTDKDTIVYPLDLTKRNKSTCELLTAKDDRRDDSNVTNEGADQQTDKTILGPNHISNVENKDHKCLAQPSTEETQSEITKTLHQLSKVLQEISKLSEERDEKSLKKICDSEHSAQTRSNRDKDQTLHVNSVRHSDINHKHIQNHVSHQSDADSNRSNFRNKHMQKSDKTNTDNTKQNKTEKGIEALNRKENKKQLPKGRDMKDKRVIKDHYITSKSPSDLKQSDKNYQDKFSVSNFGLFESEWTPHKQESRTKNAENKDKKPDIRILKTQTEIETTLVENTKTTNETESNNESCFEHTESERVNVKKEAYSDVHEEDVISVVSSYIDIVSSLNPYNSPLCMYNPLVKTEPFDEEYTKVEKEAQRKLGTRQSIFEGNSLLKTNVTACKTFLRVSENRSPALSINKAGLCPESSNHSLNALPEAEKMPEQNELIQAQKETSMSTIISGLANDNLIPESSESEPGRIQIVTEGTPYLKSENESFKSNVNANVKANPNQANTKRIQHSGPFSENTIINSPHRVSHRKIDALMNQFVAQDHITNDKNNDLNPNSSTDKTASLEKHECNSDTTQPLLEQPATPEADDIASKNDIPIVFDCQGEPDITLLELFGNPYQVIIDKSQNICIKPDMKSEKERQSAEHVPVLLTNEKIDQKQLDNTWIKPVVLQKVKRKKILITRPTARKGFFDSQKGRLNKGGKFVSCIKKPREIKRTPKNIKFTAAPDVSNLNEQCKETSEQNSGTIATTCNINKDYMAIRIDELLQSEKMKNYTQNIPYCEPESNSCEAQNQSVSSKDSNQHKIQSNMTKSEQISHQSVSAKDSNQHKIQSNMAKSEQISHLKQSPSGSYPTDNSQSKIKRIRSDEVIPTASVVIKPSLKSVAAKTKTKDPAIKSFDELMKWKWRNRERYRYLPYMKTKAKRHPFYKFGQKPKLAPHSNYSNRQLIEIPIGGRDSFDYTDTSKIHTNETVATEKWSRYYKTDAICNEKSQEIHTRETKEKNHIEKGRFLIQGRKHNTLPKNKSDNLEKVEQYVEILSDENTSDDSFNGFDAYKYKSVSEKETERQTDCPNSGPQKRNAFRFKTHRRIKERNKTRAYSKAKMPESGKRIPVGKRVLTENERMAEREIATKEIEKAVRHLRQTYEGTWEDMIADGKVANFLEKITDKLEIIQTKRNKLESEIEKESKAKDLKRNQKSDRWHRGETWKHNRLGSVDMYRISPESESDIANGNFLHDFVQEQLMKELTNVSKTLAEKYVEGIGYEANRPLETVIITPSDVNTDMNVRDYGDTNNIMTENCDQILIHRSVDKEEGDEQNRNKTLYYMPGLCANRAPFSYQKHCFPGNRTFVENNTHSRNALKLETPFIENVNNVRSQRGRLSYKKKSTLTDKYPNTSRNKTRFPWQYNSRRKFNNYSHLTGRGMCDRRSREKDFLHTGKRRFGYDKLDETSDRFRHYDEIEEKGRYTEGMFLKQQHSNDKNSRRRSHSSNRSLCNNRKSGDYSSSSSVSKSSNFSEGRSHCHSNRRSRSKDSGESYDYAKTKHKECGHDIYTQIVHENSGRSSSRNGRSSNRNEKSKSKSCERRDSEESRKQYVDDVYTYSVSTDNRYLQKSTSKERKDTSKYSSIYKPKDYKDINSGNVGTKYPYNRKDHINKRLENTNAKERQKVSPNNTKNIDKRFDRKEYKKDRRKGDKDTHKRDNDKTFHSHEHFEHSNSYNKLKMRSSHSGFKKYDNRKRLFHNRWFRNHSGKDD